MRTEKLGLGREQSKYGSVLVVHRWSVLLKHPIREEEGSGLGARACLRWYARLIQ